MKIAFHTNSIPFRGTSVVTYDYAHYNETLLNNSSYMLACADEDLSALEKFQKRFPVFLYKNFSEVDDFIKAEGIDFLYLIKMGPNDGKLSKVVPSGVHVVFKFFQPHGNKYAYVSEWLSGAMTGGTYPYVPHIIDLKDTGLNIRKHLNIPPEAKVFGYYGGPDSFNIPFAQAACYFIAKKFPDVWFLFMNVNPFCENLPNLIFLPGSYDLNLKAGFINACDACIHGRADGETFGLTIGEFSSFNKPIITHSGEGLQGYDSCHLSILKEKALLYSSTEELLELLLNFDAYKNKFSDWNQYRQFEPQPVMEKFKEVFLQ